MEQLQSSPSTRNKWIRCLIWRYLQHALPVGNPCRMQAWIAKLHRRAHPKFNVSRIFITLHMQLSRKPAAAKFE